MTHAWLDSTHNDCCSCGWRCAFNGSGTHYESRCKIAHLRHKVNSAEELLPEETFEERFSDEPNHAL